jgi:mycoredoxin
MFLYARWLVWFTTGRIFFKIKDVMNKIIMYGTPWCPDCLRAKHFFKQHNIDYDWIDIEQDEIASAQIEIINGGFKSVPTILFPDGSTLVEPNNAALKAKIDALK